MKMLARWGTEVFEEASDGMLILDESHRILAVNAAFRDLLGYNATELVRRNIDEIILEGTCPEPAALFSQLLEGRTLRGERRLTRRDGTPIPVEVSARRLSGGGVLAIVRDVTERTRMQEALRESEERYRTLVELSPDGIVIRSGKEIKFANRAAADILGFPSPQELAGRSITAVLPPEAHDAARDDFERILANGGATTVLGRRLLRRDGTELELEASAIPIFFQGEAAAQVIVRDVTERKQLEARMSEAQRLQAVGRLASGIAHDFNNILQDITTASTVLSLRGVDPTRDAAALREIDSYTRRGATLVRQLLTFARQDSTERESIDLNDVVRATESLLGRLIPPHVALRVEPCAVPLPLHADRGQLGQVLMNLVVNACDAVSDGGEIVVRTGVTEDEVWLEVRDDGRGIPAPIRDKIFEPFFTTKTPGKGTGLGLAVVHGIVSRHGGHVELTSHLDKGTTFRVVLPRTAAIPIRGEEAATTIVAAVSAVGLGSRALLVEDEDGGRELLAELLGLLGFEVTAVASAEEASCQLAAASWSLLVTDFRLPGKDGVELALEARRRSPLLPVIVISGYAKDQLGPALPDGTSLCFLQKPFDVNTLTGVISEALGRRGSSPEATS